MRVLRLTKSRTYEICGHIKIRGEYEQTVKKGINPLSIGCEYLVTLIVYCKSCDKTYQYYVAVN